MSEVDPGQAECWMGKTPIVGLLGSCFFPFLREHLGALLWSTFWFRWSTQTLESVLSRGQSVPTAHFATRKRIAPVPYAKSKSRL